MNNKVNVIITKVDFFYIYRYDTFNQILEKIDSNEGGIEKFSSSYKEFGLIAREDGILCREWIPNVENVWLYGDFSEFKICNL